MQRKMQFRASLVIFALAGVLAVPFSDKNALEKNDNYKNPKVEMLNAFVADYNSSGESKSGFLSIELVDFASGNYYF